MASQRIFDDSPRSDPLPMAATEGIYIFLNRVSGALWDGTRGVIEDWLSHYPIAKRTALARRMQSSSHGFWSAYLELFLHEVLLFSDASLDVDPLVLGRKTPDFRVTHAGTTFLLEATTLMEPRRDHKESRRQATILEALRTVRSADFMVLVVSIVQGPSQPSGTHLATQLQEWLDLLDYAEIRELGTSGPWSDMPSTALSDQGWVVVVRPIPKAKNRRFLSEIVLSGPVKGRFVDDHAAIAADLRKKARRYRSVGEPLVLAVANHRWTADSEEVRLALFGIAWEHPEMMKAQQIDPSWRGSPEGLWITRTGAQYAEVVAVLAVENHNPWDLTDAKITVWHNPSDPHPDRSLPFEHVTVDRDSGALVRTPAPTSISTILGLLID